MHPLRTKGPVGHGRRGRPPGPPFGRNPSSVLAGPAPPVGGAFLPAAGAGAGACSSRRGLESLRRKHPGDISASGLTTTRQCCFERSRSGSSDAWRCRHERAVLDMEVLPQAHHGRIRWADNDAPESSSQNMHHPQGSSSQGPTDGAGDLTVSHPSRDPASGEPEGDPTAGPPVVRSAALGLAHRTGDTRSTAALRPLATAMFTVPARLGPGLSDTATSIRALPWIVSSDERVAPAGLVSPACAGYSLAMVITGLTGTAMQAPKGPEQRYPPSPPWAGPAMWPERSSSGTSPN